jgi:hypothetical protein
MCVEGSVSDHLLDGLNARDGLFREREPERHSARQSALQVDRTAAHSLDDAGLGEWTSTQTCEDDALFWTGILEDAEDLDLELFDSITLEDGPANPVHTSPDVFQWEKALGGQFAATAQDREENHRQSKKPTEARRSGVLTHIKHCCPSWFGETLAGELLPLLH